MLSQTINNKLQTSFYKQISTQQQPMRNKTEGSTTEFIKPVTLDNNKITVNHIPSAYSSDTFPQKQYASEKSDESHFLPTGLPGPQEKNNQQSREQSQEVQINPVIEQHRLFLQNYKKQRGQQIRMIRDRFFSTHKEVQQSYVQEEDEQLQQQQEKQQQSSPYVEAIAEKMQSIHKRIERDIIRQGVHSQTRKYKLFDGVVSSKNDLERVAKERRFIRSQQEKYDYQEPQMPHKHLMPLKYRVSTQPYSDQADLAKKAREFIEKVHKEQENLLGKQILRKKKEESKRMRQEKQQQKRMQEISQIKKEERRLKAEQNLLVMREKLKINKIVNRNSIEQLRKILTEKQYRLEAMKQSMKNTETDGRPQISFSISSKMERKAKHSSASDYSQEQIQQLKPKNRELNISIDKLKKLQEKQTNIRAKLKLGPKKHKMMRPTEYSENFEERERNDSRIQTDYCEQSEQKQTISQQREQRQFLNTLKKSTGTVMDKQHEIKSEYLTQNGNSVSITQPESQAEWQLKEKGVIEFEDNTFGMMKEGRKSKQSTKGHPVSSLT